MTNPSTLPSPSPRVSYGGVKKNCEQVAGAVGLGIVAAMEKSGAGAGAGQGEILAKFFVGSLNLNRNRSDPIPIVVRVGGGGGGLNSSATSRARPRAVVGGDDDVNGGGRSKNSVFSLSPVPSDAASANPEIPAFPTADFLSSCHLCRRKLHGRDIYMYRGEKAFCSAECRYQQIVTDERKEKCRAEAARPADLSASPYRNNPIRGQIFSPGIIAA